MKQSELLRFAESGRGVGEGGEYKLRLGLSSGGENGFSLRVARRFVALKKSRLSLRSVLLNSNTNHHHPSSPARAKIKRRT